MRFRLDDILIISISLFVVAIIIALYLYKIKINNLRHTAKILIDLSILINDFQKALTRVKLFRLNEYKTEIQVHEQNYEKYKALIEKIISHQKNGKKVKQIFDIEKDLDIDINTIKTKIRKEIRILISYLEKY